MHVLPALLSPASSHDVKVGLRGFQLLSPNLQKWIGLTPAVRSNSRTGLEGLGRHYMQYHARIYYMQKLDVPNRESQQRRQFSST